MKSETTLLRATLNVPEVARIFQAALEGRKVQFEAVESKGNPFASLERQPEFSVVASRDKMSGSWAIQLYVYDEGEFRIVELHALYHSWFTRIVSGTKNTYSRSASAKRSSVVTEALRNADSSLTASLNLTSAMP